MGLLDSQTVVVNWMRMFKVNLEAILDRLVGLCCPLLCFERPQTYKFTLKSCCAARYTTYLVSSQATLSSCCSARDLL